MQRSDRIIVDREFVAHTVEDIFLKYRAELIADLRESLIKNDRDQPGDLLQSVDAKVVLSSNNITFELVMNDYWKFVDEGVDGYQKSVGSSFKYKKNGKRIPIDAMKKFIAAHGYAPKQIQKTSKKVSKRNKKVDRMKAFNSFAFAIGVNLKKFGVKPTHFFTDVINEDLKVRLTHDIEKALQKDIEIDFTTSLK